MGSYVNKPGNDKSWNDKVHVHLSNRDLADAPGAYLLKNMTTGEVYQYKSVYKIKVCSILASGKALVSVVAPSGINSCQLSDQVHHGVFKLQNEGSGKFLNIDCFFRCEGGTNVNQYDDSIFFPSNRVFELKSSGTGIHWLKIKHSDLWVAQWTDSVKLGTDAQRDEKPAASSWHLLCSAEFPNRCSFKNRASGECLVATGGDNEDDVATAPCAEDNRLQLWNLIEQD